MLSNLPGRRIQKQRYHVEWQDRRFGVDIFSGALAGLRLCEVECATVAKLPEIPVPPWASKEVSGDIRFTGGYLSALDCVEFKTLLAQFDTI